jgi:glycosyltransferase involved in cell wall biosynthesis
MNVLFVNYNDFTSNSAVHIGNLANVLTDLGVSCTVAVPGDAAPDGRIVAPRFAAVDFREARSGAATFPDGGPPALVHAWTPREVVRELTEDVCRAHGCPYVVHLEDNEDVITADRLGMTLDELHATPAARLDALVSSTVSHPGRMRRFLAGAAGMSVIVESLLEFRPDGVPAEVVWPAFEPELFTSGPGDPELRRRLGIRDDEAVVVYAGNAHASNARELRSLYLAIVAVNRAGRPLRLVRLGRDYVDFLDGEQKLLEPYVVKVPPQPRSLVPEYMRLADVLVQPGRADPFNDYRFPAKLPEFLATGRPVVLPEANVGHHLVDGEECLLLKRGDALEIAAALERLLDDAELRERLGRGGRAFAERAFSWPAGARKLQLLYQHVLSRPGRGRPAGSRRPLPPRLGYATVRGYCDSLERLPELATASRDLKDAQRPWMVEAVTAAVRPGARLLEIGAGEPLVADLLARLGYEVTALDPYDGRDGGPGDVEGLRRRFPRVRLLEGLFPRDIPPGEVFDCIYSVSVLEHLPVEAIEEACAAMRRRAGAYTIHAVDHVVLGAGAGEHLVRLRLIARSLGLEDAELDGVLVRLEADPETYFLSAEGHNRWRGSTPYADFPMRRCVSIELCVPTGEG